MREIGAQEVLELLQATVDRFPADHVYKADPGYGCRNVNFDGTGCLIGTMLMDLGITPETFRNRNAVSGGAGNTVHALHAELAELGYRFNTGAIAVMRHAQSRQDEGFTWVAALKAARAYVALDPVH